MCRKGEEKDLTECTVKREIESMEGGSGKQWDLLTGEAEGSQSGEGSQSREGSQGNRGVTCPHAVRCRS
ncbi:hypothetical protein AMTR_s00090p00082780 [Amborella trichopoda]|uniref:Uncharacterized protein n=1 Tax=Amborella trichopoda TaxID=13333 RepID=W1P121_AMBTC|nr:hypothetical protein AMTR_s00090p00082780 [Amborella trichopoda]